ncbi:MAG: hypothetical protein N3D84_02285 [Candidatus Woesearchaeota archaeon]|nr:hypothetical protein [Candidatus Woesearchaeota archaeon]
MEIFGFFSNVKESFRKIKKDIDELKESMNSWVVFLNSNQREMKQKIYELDKRLRELEMEKVAVMIKSR